MERRDVLKSMGGIATVSMVGLAGCGSSSSGNGNSTESGGNGNMTESGGNGNMTESGGSSGCKAPDDLEGTLPQGDDYSMNGDPATTEESGVMSGSVTAAYTGPNDETYSYSLTAFNKAQYAQDPNTETGSTGEDQIAAYVVVDTHLYVAVGPSKDKVTTFLATSSALTESCIESNVQWGN